MELEKALQVLKRAIKKQKEYDTGKIQKDLIVEEKNYNGWYVQAFKNGELDLDFFTGWIKINNLVFEFLDLNKMQTLNELTKILEELESE